MSSNPSVTHSPADPAQPVPVPETRPQSEFGYTSGPLWDGMSDDRGPIPTFPPVSLDPLTGQILPMSEAEMAARRDAMARTIELMRTWPDDDPPGTTREFMRGIDSHRAPGTKLFEGMY